jgi:type VII secretion-associated serine protease mycosin
VRLARIGVAVALCAAATLSVQPVPAHADATRDRQWHLRFLRVAEAHRYSQGQGITVAVIDSGVDASHPDLRRNVMAGADYLPGGGGDGRQDTDGHGTGMAGLIAAHGRGGSGALGIAPRARVLPIRSVVRDARNSAPSAVVDGIDYAIDHGAKVINISLSLGRSQEIRDAVERARAADIVIVAAAGNTNRETFVPYPGGVEGVLTVGATDRNGNHASISVSGPEVDLAAPGVGITFTNKGGGYRTGTGTSESTAIVAGAAALVRSRYPDMPADEVIHRLTATATDKGPPGRDEQYGYGVLNLVAALTADVPPAGQASALPSVSPSASPSRTAAAAAEPGPDRSSDSSTTVLALVILVVLVAAGGSAWWYARRRRAS